MNEIYRHLRPRWFNSLKHELEPCACGGISFAIKPTNEHRVYDYWVYICPSDFPFSAKQSVKRLRLAIENGTKPWATIHLTEDPIIEQVVRSVIKEEQELPSEIAKQALDILITNYYAERNRMLAIAKRHGAVVRAYGV